MFAPRVARPQTKASEGSTSGLTPQRPTNVDHALDHGPVEQAPFLQGEIVNHARARLLARRDSALPGNGRNRGKEREGVGGEDASAETAPRGVWWDFRKVSLFPPERANRVQPPFPPAETPIRGAIQAKLVVGQAHDPFEQEADRAADRVMRIGDPEMPLAAGPLRVSRKCSACEDEAETLQTKATRLVESTAHEAPEIVQKVLRSPGQPLDGPARAFFEPRFGYDFGGVRVHTDSQAAASARRISALAYTVGKDIVFGAGEYAPGTQAGRRIIAHELTHTIQQSNGDKAPVTQFSGMKTEEAPSSQCSASFDDSGVAVIRRMVSKDYPKIHSNLTYGIFDWAITDAEAHEVIVILKALNDVDLADTVAEMEKEGLVDRLFDNVSYADRFAEAVTLQRIQNVRVQAVTKSGATTVTVTGSCKVDQQKAMADKIKDTKDWAKKSKEAVSDFIAAPAAAANTAALLNKHFFHNENNPPGLTVAQQTSKAANIRDGFEKIELQANPLPNVCASPVDPQCTTLAAAYVPANKSAVMFCQPFFSYGPINQTYFLFHELTHVYAGVSDRGYGDERVFSYLPPDSAIDNADSYALFAVDVLGKTGGAAAVRGAPPQDEFTDCSDLQKAIIKRSFAFASRMITRALGALGDVNPASLQLRQGWLNTHFKTADPSALEQVIKRFQALQSAFNEAIKFQCESSCDPGVLGYYRTIVGTTSHLCPPIFQQPNEATRQDQLLTVVITERLGIRATAAAGTTAYARQTSDQAYDNASSYVAYARAVTDQWGT